MTNEQKKALYDTILLDVAKIVKKRINEASELYDGEGKSLNEELVEWESLSDITYDQYYDPELNASFNNINDEFIFLNDKNQIGFNASIEDRNGNDGPKNFQIWAESLGKALEYFDIAVEASTQDLHEKFFKITTNPVMNKFWKAWRRTLTSDQVNDKLEDCIDDFYANIFEPAKTVEEVIDGIENMKY